jgi:SAM-dependent methyltransferase
VAWYKEWFGEDYLELYAHRDVGEAERHTLALRKRGYRALGLDLSLTLLTQPPPFPRVAGDIRHLPFADGSFDWVLNFFTSFGYFADERENFEVLEEIRRVLAPGGRFLIDLFNRERVLEGLVPSETKEMDGGVAEIERWFDDSTQRINKRIRISTADYSEPEVTIGLQWAGLEADQLFGDFDGRPFDSSSDRLILVGHRPRPEERAS